MGSLTIVKRLSDKKVADLVRKKQIYRGWYSIVLSRSCAPLKMPSKKKGPAEQKSKQAMKDEKVSFIIVAAGLKPPNI